MSEGTQALAQDFASLLGGNVLRRGGGFLRAKRGQRMRFLVLAENQNRGRSGLSSTAGGRKYRHPVDRP